MNTNSIYAALDLHSAHSVLGSMNHDGQWLGWSRFRTDPEHLQGAVRALGGPDVRLTVEASALTRWAVGLLRPLVGQLVICEPRHNRLIAANPSKNDQQDAGRSLLAPAPRQAQGSLDGR